MENNQAKITTGKIHLYAGDGKGKTTAAVGLVVRAAGYGLRVMFIQFLKYGDSSELKVLQNLPNVKVLSGMPTQKFTFVMNEEEKAETKSWCESHLMQGISAADEKEIDVLILDEALGALSTGMLSEQVLLDFLNKKPETLEVVLTGRDPSQALIEIADYYSEIHAVKHPYNTEKLMARPGIEY
ncbi:MAG: cob(I)yrinic acid a,c-diamide adenosyltransferase [Clostridiaceae bacterium]|nr:cob(I)yrinic acid a,c-diamide adenosyltransferase [Clostridiaceae bacterium]